MKKYTGRGKGCSLYDIKKIYKPIKVAETAEKTKTRISGQEHQRVGEREGGVELSSTR